MNLKTLFVYFLLCLLNKANVRAEIEYNTINEDGSFRYRHVNDDIGGYYHSVDGTPDNNVRGRYGSRNPANGRIEETIYTAGPRGFRANGPNIHRKMDTAQFPVLPRGSIDDPLADPYDVPTYSFSYRAADHSRSEDNDRNGNLQGLYSFIDDVGERHTVRYAAGPGTGYQVTNAVPDNPVNVAYSGSLYKAHPSTRGKMSVQRGPGGSYKLIATGPDHRRAESRGMDGIVRGTYSFLDDKGTQRTVQYIAGAGIGYRVIKNSVGPGTHINPSIANFRLSDTDFRLANDFSSDSGQGQRSNVNSGQGVTSGTSLQADDLGSSQGDRVGGASTAYGSFGSTRGGGGGGDKKFADRKTPKNKLEASGGENWNNIATADNQRRTQGSRTKTTGTSREGANAEAGNQSRGYLYDPPSGSENNYNLNDDDVVGSLSHLATTSPGVLEINRERVWMQRHHDSTIIKNVGKWYVGLSPGQSIRAHVQNIDIVPFDPRSISPSEALRQDEIADLVVSKDKREKL